MQLDNATSPSSRPVRTIEVYGILDKKDSEKRAFNWKTIGIASMFDVTVVGIGAAALGGNFNVKLPKKS